MTEPAQISAELDLSPLVYGAGTALAGPANVVMQLALPAVGYGVVESPVESGRVTEHPFKRARTTLTYLGVALLGTDEERAAYREAVNAVHAQVRSTPESPVAYNAFDRELQLWVAACLYRGFVDVLTALHGPLDEATALGVYRQSARMGTTLQVTPDMWPPDPEAFEAYWRSAIDRLDIDETVGAYLRDLLDSRPFPWWMRVPLGPLLRFTNVGFLPPEFRSMLGLTWSEGQERRFRLLMRLIGRAGRLAPQWLRMQPINGYLWDLRRRMRQGRPLV